MHSTTLNQAFFIQVLKIFDVLSIIFLVIIFIEKGPDFFRAPLFSPDESCKVHHI